MASWTSPSNGTLKFDNPNLLTPPASAAIEVQEQFTVACRAIGALRDSKVVGEGTTYTVALSGVANVGHPNGDSITITLTNAN